MSEVSDKTMNIPSWRTYMTARKQRKKKQLTNTTHTDCTSHRADWFDVL